MSLKSILVPMTGGAADRQALDLALALGRPFGAHIGALYPKRDPKEALAYVGLGGDFTGVQTVMDQIEREGAVASTHARTTLVKWSADARLKEVDTPATQSQVTVGWREPVGAPDALVAQAARAADLVVCPALRSHPGIEQDFLEAALFDAARPVVAAPSKLPLRLFGCAVVAWNGSREANHALTAMLSFLPKFERVQLFCQAESHRAPIGVEAALELLAWHGINAPSLTVSSPGDSVGVDLLTAAASVDATFLIMGGYTHGRMRQYVFGGVTHHVVHHAAIPVLFAH